MAIRTYRDYRKSLTDLAKMMENGVEVEADIRATILIQDIALYMAKGGRIAPAERVRSYSFAE